MWDDINAIGVRSARDTLAAVLFCLGRLFRTDLLSSPLAQSTPAIRDAAPHKRILGDLCFFWFPQDPLPGSLNPENSPNSSFHLQFEERNSFQS